MNRAKEELLARMTSRYYESNTPTTDVAGPSDSPVRTNKYSMLQSVSVDYTSPQQQAKSEFQEFQRYNDVAYLPLMKPLAIEDSWLD